jgi:bifunctional non-homologous end joining protein LigD
MRKASLARLLARRVDGIFLSDFEQGEIGPIYSGMPACSG